MEILCNKDKLKLDGYYKGCPINYNSNHSKKLNKLELLLRKKFKWKSREYVSIFVILSDLVKVDWY